MRVAALMPFMFVAPPLFARLRPRPKRSSIVGLTAECSAPKDASWQSRRPRRVIIDDSRFESKLAANAQGRHLGGKQCEAPSTLRALNFDPRTALCFRPLHSVNYLRAQSTSRLDRQTGVSHHPIERVLKSQHVRRKTIIKIVNNRNPRA